MKGMHHTTPEIKSQALFDEFAEILAFVQGAFEQGGTAHAVETGLWQRMLQLGRNLFGGWLELLGDGDAGERIVLVDGREVHRWRRAGHGFGNTNSPIQHVGIGTDTQIPRVVVRWPSGIEQTLLDPALFQVHQVIETGLLLTGPTVLGGQVDLDLVGPAGQVANLYYSGTTAQLPLPGFGLLQLLPPVIPLGAATLDGTGQGTASFPIPANPSFLGLSVYVQGWFHEPLSLANTALSNAVTVTIQ